ncbi:MAG: sigma factor G inhibitor Gin [Candidatus Pristimantibacillus sp.]
MSEDRQLHCIICGEHKVEGEGIRIVSEFICETCEAEMVRTDVKDAKYPFFIHQMKQIFIEKNA